METKCDDIKDLISNLQEIVQNQSNTFNEDIQFLKTGIQRLEEKSQVQKEVIEKLSSENEILKKQINETIIDVREQGDQIKNDEFNNIQSMFDYVNKNTFATYKDPLNTYI